MDRMDGMKQRSGSGGLLGGLLLAGVLIGLGPATLSAQQGEKEAQVAALFDYLYGEETAGEHRDAVREGIREKLRVSPQELAAMLQVTLPEQFGSDREDDFDPVRVGAEFRETAINAAADVEAEIHAAINPTDSTNIVVGVITMFGSGGGGGAEATTSIYHTHDFGQTWQKSSRTFRSTGFDFVVGGGDPMFAFDSEGTLYYSWIDLTIDQSFQIRNAMSWASSTDGGTSWRQETNDQIGAGILGNGGSSGEMFDKQWMVVDRSGSERNGRLYVGLVHSFRGSQTSGGMGIRTKREGEPAFIDLTARVPGNDWAYSQLASTVVDPEGKLHMMFFGSRLSDPGDMALWLSGSVDGGQSMLPARRITDIQVPVFSAGQQSERVLGFRRERTQPSSHLAVDLSDGPHHGTLYAVWSGNGIAEKGTSRNDIWFVRSSDRGQTWSEPMIVNDDGDAETGRGPHDQFHPSIAVNDRGVVTLSWYDRRDDPANRLTHYYMAHSFDGGATFSENFAVSSAPSDFAQIGAQNNGFGIGEYVQVVASDHYAIPVWADGRKNSGDIDVYVAFVPIGPTSSVAERIGTIDGEIRLRPVRLDPTAGHATVSIELAGETDGRIDILDLRGSLRRTIHEGRIGRSEDFSFRTDDLPSGTWFVRAETDRGVAQQTFVIRR